MTEPSVHRQEKSLPSNAGDAQASPNGSASPLLARFHAARRRTHQIFDLLEPDAFAQRPIPLRHPIRFYEGHLASFNLGMLLQSGAVATDPQPELTSLFARGIDPLDEEAADAASIRHWPERGAVHEYVQRVDAQMESAVRANTAPLYLHTAIEHEEMHQETLLYLIHRLPHALKRKPTWEIVERDKPAAASWVEVEGGRVVLGSDAGRVAFGWDNEFPAHEAEVRPFAAQSRKVSNGDFLEFVEAGGYHREELWSAEDWRYLYPHAIDRPPFWRRHEDEWAFIGLFEDMPLPLEWPVFVSHMEARAYTRWHGARLMTEAEWHRLAVVSEVPEAGRDNFDFARWNPSPTPGGTQLAQLTGNGWEWTSIPFAGFPGFVPAPHYPGYSADFFDERHYVLKGASPVTATGLVRPGFRNWFQDQYRYAYTGFRCVRER